MSGRTLSEASDAAIGYRLFVVCRSKRTLKETNLMHRDDDSHLRVLIWLPHLVKNTTRYIYSPSFSFSSFLLPSCLRGSSLCGLVPHKRWSHVGAGAGALQRAGVLSQWHICHPPAPVRWALSAQQLTHAADVTALWRLEKPKERAGLVSCSWIIFFY